MARSRPDKATGCRSHRNASNSPAAAATTWRCLARCSPAPTSPTAPGIAATSAWPTCTAPAPNAPASGRAGWPPASSRVRGSRGACFIDADAAGADLSDARAAGSQWIGAKLTHTQLAGADFSGADLRAARLAVSRGQPELAGALLEGATAPGAEHPDLPRPARPFRGAAVSLFAPGTQQRGHQHRLFARRPPPALRRHRPDAAPVGCRVGAGDSRLRRPPGFGVERRLRARRPPPALRRRRRNAAPVGCRVGAGDPRLRRPPGLG
jgi:hypothetical protein